MTDEAIISNAEQTPLQTQTAPVVPITPVESQALANAVVETEIHVIPDQFYGAALKTKIIEKEKMQQSGAALAPKKSHIGLIVGVLLVIAIVGGGGFFAYQYKDQIFAKPAPAPEPVVQVPVVVAPIPVPSAPTDLKATSTNPTSISLSWTDTASNESAVRIERRNDTGTIYDRLTDLPPNSSNFQDNSVQASTAYFYRVIARNETGESAPSNEAQATTQALPPAPPKQEPLPPAGLDTDSDGLTDLEETILTADIRNPDTDGDGYLDGNEVFNLYDPTRKAPAKLLGGGQVKVADAPMGWSVTIPTKWNLTLDQADGSLATVDTGHGEMFKISIENNDQNLSVIDWFVAREPQADKTKLMQFKSKKGYTGIIGPDLLTTYIPWGDKIFVFKYDMDKQPFINFRTLYSMILNSLVLKGLPQKVVPSGTGQLPFEPGATQPGTVTQPAPVFATSSSSATSTAPGSPTSTTP
jgi:hypothetical protein